MARIYLSVLCLIVASEAAWVRVWEDNFDWNGGVDLNKWDFDEGGGGWGKRPSRMHRSIDRRSSFI